MTDKALDKAWVKHKNTHLSHLHRPNHRNPAYDMLLSRYAFSVFGFRIRVLRGLPYSQGQRKTPKINSNRKKQNDKTKDILSV